MDNINADKRIAHSILDQTRMLLEKHGSRIPGTKGSIDAAASIAQLMRQFCDKISEESFIMHPGSLFNIGRVISVIYALSALLLFLGGIFVYASLALCILALAYAVVHYFLYGRFFDKLFKKRLGCNAVGVIEPLNKVKQQVVVAGHHDSPYVFNFFSRFKRFAGIRFLLAMLFYLYITALSIVAALTGVFSETVWQLRDVNLILALIGFVFEIPMFFFISTKASPGAGDNLNGSSIAINIGRYFSDRKMSGSALSNTRLILLSTDGEEAGQRGAMEYVIRHKKELTEIPTHMLDIDSVYSVNDLAVLLRDRHGFVPLSAGLAKECTVIANELGYNLKAIPAPFGSGTDAAAFAKEGIHAISLIGMPTTMFAKEYIYHTLRDTVESIEPEAVEAVFNIVANYIIRSDRALESKE